MYLLTNLDIGRDWAMGEEDKDQIDALKNENEKLKKEIQGIKDQQQDYQSYKLYVEALKKVKGFILTFVLFASGFGVISFLGFKNQIDAGIEASMKKANKKIEKLLVDSTQNELAKVKTEVRVRVDDLLNSIEKGKIIDDVTKKILSDI